MTRQSKRDAAPTPTEQTPSRTGLGPVGAGSPATLVAGYLLAGPLLYGGLGWLADRWLDTAYLTPVGVLVGLGLSLVTIWVRYGKR